MIARKFWLTISVVMALTSVSAQETNYQFRHLNVSHGLSHNQITSFLKDEKGILWIGTNAGLNRFDGYSIRTFMNNPDDENSISNNSITSLSEFPGGRLAVFTAGGLNIFDPVSEKFERDLSPDLTAYKIPRTEILSIIKEDESVYWFLHASNGLSRYDEKERITHHIGHLTSDSQSIASDSISSLVVNANGSAWLIHRNGVLEKIQREAGQWRVVVRNTFLRERNSSRGLDYQVTADLDGDLWILVRNDPQGVYFFQTSTETFRLINTRTTPRLNADLTSSISQDDNGLIWVGTDHGGVNLIDKKSFSVRYVVNKPEDEKSIGQNSVNTIYRDDEGIMWLGTFKRGVSYYHENLIRFPLYRHFPLAKTGLPYGDVNRFIEDKHGNLWIGTNGGGLIYFDRSNNVYKQFLHDPNDPQSLGSNVIVSLCIDHQGKLWIGTYYGGLNVYDGRKFIRYLPDADKPGSISDNNVWEIFEDSEKRLWIGTMRAGLNLFDRNTNTFTHYKEDDVNSVSSNYVSAITEDKAGNIWVGTNEGLDVLDRTTGRFHHYDYQRQQEGSLSDNNVFDLHHDTKGRMWVATKNGLNLFNADKKTFKHYKTSDGLAANAVLTILEDNSGTLWFSTTNGLSNMTENDGLQFRNYDEADGLQGKQFNENAALKLRSGELVFGGADGFNIFFPEKLGVNKNIPEVVISDFQIYNTSIVPGHEIDGHVVLDRSITYTDEVTLSPGQNVFSLTFAALNFFNPEKNQYQYTLIGFHEAWLRADATSRSVTFTNLNPGEYIFKVRASNNDGYWNEQGATLKIVVLPPFWKTKTAFVLYFLFIISGLLVTRRLIQKRERLKFERQQEIQEAARMHELDMMKIRFFTNVSHEFRTPLALILAPLEKMLKHPKDAEQQQHHQLIYRNARRLLNLVNQLLDFRKIEVQELKLNISEGDIISFIKETVLSFTDLSEKKDIKLQFRSDVLSLETFFDQDKLEKILFNLLSNAFKFTREHGSVSVDVSVSEKDPDTEIKIFVRDTGIGIAGAKLDRIFDRFFQSDVPGTMMNQGSGIGLSITREFVKVHGGSIAVESTVGEGSVFIVTLPLKKVCQLEETVIPEVAGHPTNHKPVLLLVEDNEDFRFYLKDNLRSQYSIREAANGKDGLRLALELHPDLIVSDIMMPEMNGVELCRKIKNDARISHIPVILLTARSAEEQKLEGFESGADDFISKPFNFQILVSRIKNLIEQRKRLHKEFPELIGVQASALNITSLDEQLIQKAIRCVEANVGDPEFSVEDLSHELGISRAHFYKKIIALTGKSPLEFIRVIRLQQAAQLLEKSQLTVAEVAYKVGFNNPKYFARYFKEAYNVLPSVFASGSKKTQTDATNQKF